MTQALEHRINRPERVPATVRLASVAAFLAFLVIGATARHHWPLIGLALVAGSAMFLTPELIETIISGNAWTAYIATVSILSFILIPAVIIGSVASTLGTWKAVALSVAAILEFILLIGGVPWYLTKVAKFIIPDAVQASIKNHVSQFRSPLSYVSRFDDSGGFLALGAVMFLLGTALQFLSGL
jgi:hypothetical protein